MVSHGLNHGMCLLLFASNLQHLVVDRNFKADTLYIVECIKYKNIVPMLVL